MGGRQAHGRPLLSNPAAASGRKKNKKSGGSGGGGAGSGSRGLRTRQGGRVDVMALAEKQVGTSTKLKGVRLRDLDVADEDQPKRRRNEDDEDDDEEGGGPDGPKRRRTNNDRGAEEEDDDDSDDGGLHSDSSGNEWREGVGSGDDDSEIDSDEAFGDSDDEEMFDAFAFRGSASSADKTKKKTKKAAHKTKKPATAEDGDDDDAFANFDHGSSDDEDVGDDGADLGDEAIDLAQALDIVSSDDEGAASVATTAANRKQGKNKSKPLKASNKAGSDNDILSEESSSSDDGDDEDSDTDGSDVDSASESESESESESDDDLDEDLDDDVLQGIAAKFTGDHRDSGTAAAATSNPYAFALQDLDSKDRSLTKTVQKTALASAGDSTNSNKTKVTARALDVPLATMLQDRQLRQAAAEKAHETLDRWTETVKQNRRADHLQFDVAGSLASKRIDTVTLTPALGPRDARTELEKTVLSIMEESGLGPRSQAEATERAALGMSDAVVGVGADGSPLELAPEALKELIGQKRRQRALQSAEAARAKRIKKIKSKAYRRIRRRERAKTEALLEEAGEDGEGDDGDSEAERDAQHRRRALERMGARHRDSKWAKRAKGTNRAAWDNEFRSGMADMARQSEALRRRVEGRGEKGINDDSSSSNNSSSDDDNDDDVDDEAFKLRTIEKLNKVGKAAGAGDAVPGLMGMAFMQRAELAHKKANDEAVAELLRDLNAAGDGSDDDGSAAIGEEDEGDKVVGRRTYGTANAGKIVKATAGRQRATEAADVAAIRNGAAGAAKAFTAAALAEATAALTPAGGTATTFSVAASAGLPGDGWEVVAKSQRKKKTNSGAAADAGSRLMMDAVVEDLFLRNNEVLQADAKAAEAAAAAKQEKSKAKAAAAQDAKTKKTTTKATGDLAPDGHESDTSSSGSSSGDSDDEESGRAEPGHRRHHRVNRENATLLAKALGDDDGAAQFARDKARQMEEEAAEALVAGAAAGDRRKRRGAAAEVAVLDGGLPGWGSWAGEGISRKARERQEQRRARAAQARETAVAAKKATRRDAKLERVVIREARVKKNDVYLASQLPHEFETQQQYERSLRLPVGPEWTTKMAFQAGTKPRVLVKQGVVLPMAKPLV